MKAFTVLTVLLVLVITGCAGTDKYESYLKLNKELQKGVRYSCEGNAVRYTSDELMLEATYLSPEHLDLYFSLFKGGIYQNPFPSGSYTVFSLTIENRGKRKMTFNPGMAMLLTQKGQPVIAKDYTTLYTELEVANADDLDKRMEAFKAACFDASVTLGPGERVERLIAFARNEEFAKGVMLVVDSLYLGHTAYTVPFNFKEGIPAD